MTLPTLLEETSRPDKKRLKTFYDYIHRWRSSLFSQWKTQTSNRVSDETIGSAVDRLIGLVVLLEHCRRYGYFDIALTSFSYVWQHGGTLEDLQCRIVDLIPCPILRKVFEPNDTVNIPLPLSFPENGFEQRICNSLWLMLREQPIPLWLFGDYHQLCVANPHGTFGERKRSSQVRYARGIHYTPAPIVDYLTATVLDGCIPRESECPGILDPSCGCGSFLIAAFRYLVARYVGDAPCSDRERQVSEILRHSLFGVDVDSQAVDWTIRLLYLECKRLIGNCEVDPLTVPDISNNFRVVSFFDVNRQTFGGRVNTILGGPPFVRYAALKKTQPELIGQLRERFSSIKTGQFDLYMPFIEHAVNLLDGEGLVGFSLSNTFLHTETGRGICQFITDHCSPLEVLEFSGGSIYPYAFVQIALIRLAVGKRGQDQGRHVFLEPTTDIRVSLEYLFSTNPLPSRLGQVSTLPKNELIPNNKLAMPNVQTGVDGVRFGDLPVEFLYGATPKSDEIFMLRDQGVGSQGIRHGLTRHSKERIQCERELSVPIIRGREIRGFRYSPVKYFYLAPYAEGKLLDWKSLETGYPLTFRYLERFQGTSNDEGSEPWYSYYSIPAHRSGVVIVSCRIASPHSFARMDLTETTIHGSAFGIAINDQSIDPCLFLLYLNSGYFWRQLDATMPPMGVGRRAIRMSILKELFIPRQIAFPADHHIVEAKALEKRIVQIVGKKKSEAVKSVFTELDFFIERVVS